MPSALHALERIHHTLLHIESALHKSGAGPVTCQDLNQVKETIMSAISDFAAKQSAFNDRQDAAVAAIEADLAFLNETIEKFQNSPGTITPEDQALLDALEARSDAATAKLEALDALTPPKPPTA